MASGLENIETIESPFRRFVTTIGVFPTAFTDAMTYYECLAYLVKYLEETVIPAVNENAEALKELQEYYVQLKSYVDNYFANLDVQEEINNKLDQMAEAGTLQEIIAAYIQANVAWTFDSVTDMKASTNLVDGSYAQTLGYYAVNDDGAALYKIRTVTNADVVDEMFILSLPNSVNLVAELIVEHSIHTKQVGIKGDGVTDDTTKLNTFFEKAVGCNKRIVDHGTYKITDTVYIKGSWRVDTGNNGQKRVIFDDATLLYDGNAGEASVVLYNMFKYDVDGLCIARNSASNYVQIVGCWHLNYHDWDIQDLHIDNETTNLEGKTYSTTSCMYVAGNAIYVKGTLTLGATSGSFNNVISFYNSIFNATDKTTCVKLLGATSKQNIQFISCDLSYATASVYEVNEAQTGSCSITAIGCYYDSGIKVFAGNDKKGVLYTCISSLSAANTNNEKQNILFTDYNKNAVIANVSPFGNNLALANVNYAINGDLSYNAGSQSGNYGYLMGEPSGDWAKAYVEDARCINGKVRQITLNKAGNKGINIGCVTAPRTDKYSAFVHFQIVEGSCDSIQFNFKSQYLTIDSDDIGNNEVLIINNKGNVTVNEGTDLGFALTFNNASAGLKVKFFEVGVTAGNTYIPNMPLDSRAKLS